MKEPDQDEVVKDHDGDDCEHPAADPSSEEPRDWSAITADELASLDRILAMDDEAAQFASLADLYGSDDFFAPGGGWGGSEAPARRAQRIGVANGLKTTATKEQRPDNPGSDHDVDNSTAFAVDLSNFTAPTPQMDRTAQQIAVAAGIRPYSFGFREIRNTKHRIRLQLIYRSASHYNHVHAGFKRT